MVASTARAVSVRLDRLHQVAGASVMQEKQPLADAPERRRAELIRSRRPLVDAIRQTRAHVVEGKVRVWMVGHVGHPGEVRWTRGKSG